MYGERACVLARACPHLRYRCGCTLRMYGERVCVLAAHVCGRAARAARVPSSATVWMYKYNGTRSVCERMNVLARALCQRSRVDLRTCEARARFRIMVGETRERRAHEKRAMDGREGCCELTAHLARHVSVRLWTAHKQWLSDQSLSQCPVLLSRPRLRQRPRRRARRLLPCVTCQRLSGAARRPNS